jgi:glycosyltransferase involved in cell wall biosynthesis
MRDEEMPTIALSMIMKNAGADLRECLESVRGIVDEIVIADTGSSDSSMEIARTAGAKLFSVPWENDFAKARNFSLSRVTSDWVLALDADERLDPGARERLPSLMADPDISGYQVTIRNYVLNPSQKIWDRSSQPNRGDYSPARSYPAFIDHENVRLFRRNPEIYFVGRVHETVGWRIKELGGKLGQANFCIHHFGMVRDQETIAKKIVFYRNLGLQKLADLPDNPQAHFEVGIVELENLSNPAGALTFFERACQLNPKFGEGWFFAAKTQFLLGQYATAIRSLNHAEAAGHSTPAAAELTGDAHYNMGDYAAAVRSYKRGVRLAPGSSSLKSKLGLAEARTGRQSAGLRLLREAIQSEPSNPELHDRLVTVEVWLNLLPQAAADAEKKLSAVTPRPEDFLRAASIRAQLAEWSRAAGTLRKGLATFPDSVPLRNNLAQLETVVLEPRSMREERPTPCT